MDNLLDHWKATIREPLDIQPTHEKPDGLVVSTHFVTAQDGKRFVLKNIQDRPESMTSITSEIDVLQHLHKCGVPVAVPVLADNDQYVVEDADGAYLLYPVLPVDDENAPYAEKQVVYTNIGRALAKLHQALASYPGQIDSWTMNLPKTIAEDAVPEIERALAGNQLERFQKTFATLEPEMNQALADLPMQTTHGDCHGGNILLYQGDVSGFIDLDHLPYAPRCYDIAYIMADFAKGPLFGVAYHENWLDNFAYVLNGYEKVERLKETERNALWYMMLCVQLMFAYWLFKYQSADAAQKNMESFYWLYDHKTKIIGQIALRNGAKDA